MSAAPIRICAEAGAAGTVIATIGGVEPWRPRILAGGAAPGYARVALVQSRASLLRADDVALEVSVGPGAALELVELGALLAHSTRGGAGARVSATVAVGEGGRLIWLGQPLIVAAGASVTSTIAIALAPGARVLRGESVVLGRAGEQPGALHSRVRILHAGAPVLDETLDTGELPTLRSAVVAADATMIAAVTLAGARAEQPASGAMQAHGPATLWRGAGDTVGVGGAAAAVAERWRPLCAAAQRKRFAGL